MGQHEPDRIDPFDHRRAALRLALQRFGEVCDGDPLTFLGEVADLLQATAPKRLPMALNANEADVLQQVGLAIMHLQAHRAAHRG
jgi:hypothetical protein